MCERLAELREALERYGAAFDPALLDGPSAARVVTEAGAIEAMAAALKARAGLRVADTGLWQQTAQPSAAHHLARATGTSVGQAHEPLATARRLKALPATAQAARTGQISSSQAAVVADAASADPSSEARLLSLARSASLSELRQEAARVKAAAEPDLERRRARIHARRHLRSYTDAEGGWHLRVFNNPEVGAQIMAAVSGVADRLFHTARRQGRREPVEAYAADALTEIVTGADTTASAERPATEEADGRDDAAREGAGDGADPAGNGAPPSFALNIDDVDDTADDDTVDGDEGADGNEADDVQGDAHPGAGADGVSPSDADAHPGDAAADPGDAATDAAAGPGPATAPAPRRQGAPTKVIFRLDLEALFRGYPLEGEVCEIAGFGPVAVSAVKDVLEKANPFLAAVLTKGQAVLGVAHLGRRPTAKQRTALEWMSPECTVLGCSARAHLEIDHRRDWAQTHHTLLEELDHHCGHHHNLKTNEGWALVEGTGKRAFVPPDDPRHPRHKPPPAPEAHVAEAS